MNLKRSLVLGAVAGMLLTGISATANASEASAVIAVQPKLLVKSGCYDYHNMWGYPVRSCYYNYNWWEENVLRKSDGRYVEYRAILA